MKYAVHVTLSAERDMEAVHGYLDEHAGRDVAAAFLDTLDAAIASLSRSPSRGGYPPELAALGNREYRQLQLPPYRMIYRIAGRKVIIELIADGRRDMRTLLQRRLLAPP